MASDRVIKRTTMMYAVYGMDTGPARATLAYDPADPFAVSLAFGDGNTWTFARDLLADGRWGKVGAGDVQISCVLPDWMTIVLSSPDGMCVLLADRQTVAQFLGEVAAAGESELDVDDCVERILRGAR